MLYLASTIFLSSSTPHPYIPSHIPHSTAHIPPRPTPDDPDSAPPHSNPERHTHHPTSHLRWYLSPPIPATSHTIHTRNGHFPSHTSHTPRPTHATLFSHPLSHPLSLIPPHVASQNAARCSLPRKLQQWVFPSPPSLSSDIPNPAPASRIPSNSNPVYIISHFLKQKSRIPSRTRQNISHPTLTSSTIMVVAHSRLSCFLNDGVP